MGLDQTGGRGSFIKQALSQVLNESRTQKYTAAMSPIIGGFE